MNQETLLGFNWFTDMRVDLDFSDMSVTFDFNGKKTYVTFLNKIDYGEGLAVTSNEKVLAGNVKQINLEKRHKYEEKDFLAAVEYSNLES